MGKLLYTGDIGFRMNDWDRERIAKVFAGTGCIMAVTEDGRTLQKTVSEETAARMQYWTRIREISVSDVWEGLALGLVSDGTCLIGKRAVRRILGSVDRAYEFDEINARVKSWRNIVQAAASDALFALDASGRVHMAAFEPFTDRDYAEVLEWRDVRRLSVGMQHCVFGITGDGRLLAAGHNCRKGPHGDVCRVLSKQEGVVDVCAAGSEAENIYMAFRDGSVRDLDGNDMGIRSAACKCSGPAQVMDSYFAHRLCIKGEDGRLYLCAPGREPEPVFSGKGPVGSFAFGDRGYGASFLLAVAEQNASGSARHSGFLSEKFFRKAVSWKNRSK